MNDAGGREHDPDAPKARGGFFDRPLWRIMLSSLLVAFVGYRAIYIWGLATVDRASPVILAGYLVQCAAGVIAAVGLFFARRFTRVAILALGITIAATALLRGMAFGTMGLLWASAQALVVLIATAVGWAILGHEIPRRPRPSP